MPPASPQPAGRDAWSRGSSTFGHRLRMYLVGVSIGVILLGFFWASKNQAARRAASERAAPANTAPAGNPAADSSPPNPAPSGPTP